MRLRNVLRRAVTSGIVAWSMARQPRPDVECLRCGYRASVRAFEIEVALSADDSGDSDWVVNFSCPRCECANAPKVLVAGATVPDGSRGLGTHRTATRTANATYDPAAP